MRVPLLESIGQGTDQGTVSTTIKSRQTSLGLTWSSPVLSSTLTLLTWVQLMFVKKKQSSGKL